MEKVKIKTTQNVDVEYEIASIGDRIVAVLIDYLILLVCFIALMILSIFIRDILNEYMYMFFFLIYIPMILYDLLFEIFMNGQTPGKKFRNIKVIKMDGSQPTIGNYLLRWVFRLIDIGISYGGIAILTILINGKGQRIGDIAAGTTVIKLKKSVSLQDTIFKKVEENYQGTFPQVESLSNEEIETIKEVIKTSIEHHDAVIRNKLLLRTKTAIEKKLGINSNMMPRAFLEVMIKDYNYYKGKVNF